MPRVRREDVRAAPKGYSPKAPAGLLVWTDAGGRGEPPPSMFEALDKGNLIVVSAENIGNGRSITNRVQVGLDLVATASRRFHIDPERVFVSGSRAAVGSRRCWRCAFPTSSSGRSRCAASINISRPNPRGGGGVPASFNKPTGKRWMLLKRHRIAMVTGGNDLNKSEIDAAAQVLLGDDLEVRVFEDTLAGHMVASDNLFPEALAYVDEPYQECRKQAEAAQARDWTRLESRLRGPLTNGDKQSIQRLIDPAPWSATA